MCTWRVIDYTSYAESIWTLYDFTSPSTQERSNVMEIFVPSTLDCHTVLYLWDLQLKTHNPQPPVEIFLRYSARTHMNHCTHHNGRISVQGHANKWRRIDKESDILINTCTILCVIFSRLKEQIDRETIGSKEEKAFTDYQLDVFEFFLNTLPWHSWRTTASVLGCIFLHCVTSVLYLKLSFSNLPRIPS